MALYFPLEIHTPHRLFYSDYVEAFILTLIDGQAAVYANHSPFTAPIVPCLLKIKKKNGGWQTASISEGILEVKSRKTVLISDSAEWVD
jgi:F-type H+-transporting ATPase subunit epsilon